MILSRLEGAMADAPCGREAHPCEEHRLPLMAAAGVAPDGRGRSAFRDKVMDVVISAIEFGQTA